MLLATRESRSWVVRRRLILNSPEKTMNALEVSQRSIDAWNRHDADALVAVYAEGGTYHNPRFDHPLTGQAIGDFAKSVWAAYPDASLEIISRGDAGAGLVATQF